jgi:hypothetical protein
MVTSIRAAVQAGLKMRQCINVIGDVGLQIGAQ